LKKINEGYRYFMGLMERRFTIHLKQIKECNASTSTEMIGYSSRTAENVRGKRSSKADRDEDVENFPIGNHGDSGIDPSGKNQSALEHDDRVASQATSKKNKKKPKSAEVKSNEDEGSDFDLSSLDSDSSSETDDPPLENLDDGSSDSDGSLEEYIRDQVKKNLMDFSESSEEELESDDDRQAVVRKGLSSDSDEEKHPVKQEKLEEDIPDENEVPQASSSRRNSSQHESMADEASLIISGESENQSKNGKDLDDRRFMQKLNRKILESDESDVVSRSEELGDVELADREEPDREVS
jgi:hypothetical protein